MPRIILLPYAIVTEFLLTATFLCPPCSLCKCVCVRLCAHAVQSLNRSRCVLVVREGHASCHISSDLLLWHVCMLEALSLTHRKWSHECAILCTCISECEPWFTETLFYMFSVRGERKAEGSRSGRICICLHRVLIVKYAVTHAIKRKLDLLWAEANH